MWAMSSACSTVYAAAPESALNDIQQLGAQNQPQRQAVTAEVEKALKSGVEQRDINTLLATANDRNYSAEDAAQFIKKLADVQNSGLPVKLVRDKIFEGMSKQVPAAAVIKVADNWHKALGDSRAMVHDMEKKGLAYAKPQEKADLINEGAVLEHRFKSLNTLQEMASVASKGGQGQFRAATIIAAARVSEVMLMSGATVQQAVSLPVAGLKAGFSAPRMQEMQRTVLDQLQQGVAVTDVISGVSSQFSPGQLPGQVPGSTPFNSPGHAPGSFGPGGAFPGGGAPGNPVPGGSMSSPPGGGVNSSSSGMAPGSGGFGTTGPGDSHF